jgi:hypothetical protein
METLISFSKSSIEELSIAALACIKEVVHFIWGLRDLESSEKIGYFLERTTETRNVIKEWKYSIVQAIAMQSVSTSIFPKTTFQRIQEYNKQGPFKVEYVPSVAFQSA